MSDLGRPTQPQVRVLVVDDDAVFRRILARMLEALPQVCEVETASTLALARNRIDHGNFDVVLLDVVLRDESGLELLAWLREHHPHIRAILVTAGQSDGARTVVDALFLGAAGLVLKPAGRDAETMLREQLVQAVTVGASAKGTICPSELQASRPAARDPMRLVMAKPREVITIGASTGGPPVVSKILRHLAPSFDTPILITQHMPAGHMGYFVELLANQSGRRVMLAAQGTRVERGCAYVAPGDVHMVLARDPEGLLLRLFDGPPEHNCRPAVDPMFRSVAAVCGAKAAAALLTGMGADGAEGAKMLRAGGAPVVIQDRASSVVWGMPGAAHALGAYDEVVAGDDVGRVLESWTAASRMLGGQHG